MVHRIATFVLVIVAVSSAAASAPAASIEKLGEPCRAFNILNGRYVKDPSGREWMVLTSSNEATHCQLLFIDYKNDQGKIFTASAGSGAWSLNVVPNDALMIGTYYDGTFARFDLAKMAFTKTAKVPGEDYIWGSVIGGDGRLYGGTYPGAHLVALDLESFKVEDYGCGAPPNHYLRPISTLPDGRIYCSLGMDKPARVIFDPTTKKFSPAPPQMKDVEAGVSFQGCFVAANSWDGETPAAARVFAGKTLEPVTNPPFPTPPENGTPWSADLRSSTADALIYRHGGILWRCRAGASTLEKIFEGNLRAAVIAQTPDGKLLCTRGPEYAVLTPGDRELEFKPVPCERPPRPTHWLRVDPQGRIWGGPQFGQTVFYFDPKTKRAVNTGLVCGEGGEVYDGAFRDGKTYLVSYVGGDIIEFDPAQPWDQIHNKNPRVIHHLAKEGYVRPIGGAQFGSDGKLYSSWSAKYGTYGGAIAISDVSTGDTELIETPLGKQSVSAFALDDQFIYAGTDLSANGLPQQKGVSPKFGMIDRKTRQVVFEQAFDGAAGVNRLCYDAASKRVVLAVNGKVKLFDPATRKLLHDAARSAPSFTGGSLVGLGDGKAYYANEKRLIELNVGSGETHAVVEFPANIEKIALGGYGTIYAT